MADQLAMGGGSSAELSPCRRYRYVLRREWDPSLPPVLFVMLNPSTADEHQDDPTIRRCLRFAREWGYGALWVGNLYGWRATKPDQLSLSPDPVGPENDAWLSQLAWRASLVVVAWGASAARGDRRARADAVVQLLRAARGSTRLVALRITPAGCPHHPLYMPAATRPIPYPAEAGGTTSGHGGTARPT